MTGLFAELERHDRGERRGLRAHRVVMSVFALISLTALTGALGQRSTGASAATGRATREVRAPETVRGGLFFQARVTIRVRGRLQHPRLVLDPGWLEGMQVNSIEPQPQDESSRDGRLVLAYSTWLPGQSITVWLQFQVNPTNVGRRPFGLELDDGTTRIARVPRTLTILP